jgi:hypothetical protein
MDLDPIEDHKDTTKDALKDHAKPKIAANTRSKQVTKSKSTSSKDRSSTKSSSSGVKKRPKEPTDYSRAALEQELADLKEEEAEYKERLWRKEDSKLEKTEEDEKGDEVRRPRRRAPVQKLRMKREVEDISSKMGAMGMERENERQG